MSTRAQPKRPASLRDHVLSKSIRLDDQSVAAIAAALASGPPREPRLALSVEEACRALGVSWDTWREHVEPEVRIVRCGRRKLIAVTELQRWLDDRGERVMERRS